MEAIFTTIPNKEISRRREAVLLAMKEQRINLGVFTTAAGVHYLTGIDFGGFATRHALVLRDDGESVFVVREIEQGWSTVPEHREWVDEWAFYPDEGEWHTTLEGSVNGLLDGPGRVAAETSRPSLSWSEAQSLVDTSGVSELVDIAPLIEGIRAVKSEFEIAAMRACGRATAAGTRAAWAELGLGASDHEATLEATRAMYQAGSQFLCDGPFVVTGASSALAHARGSSRHAAFGEVASTMMSASIGRYQCPVERSFAIGAVEGPVDELLRLAATATQHVVARLEPGLTSSEADGIARDFWRARGREASFTHRLAYSVGTAYPPLWWENDVMQLRPGDSRRVEAGMTFHVVPGIHVEGLGFINQSATVVITQDGCEPLCDLELVLDPA